MGSMVEKLRKAYEGILATPKPVEAERGEPGRTVAICTTDKTGELLPVAVKRVTERLAGAFPEMAEKIRTAPIRPSPGPASEARQEAPAPEKPTKLINDPVVRTRPTIAGPGGSMTPSPLRRPLISPEVGPVVAAAPVRRELHIQSLQPQTARRKDPMPAERLAANVSPAPRDALLALAEKRMTATRELDRLGDKSRQLFHEPEP